MEFDEATRQVIARAVRERRAALGLSQEQAARASGGMISTANLRVVEGAGRSTFREKSLVGVARAMRWPSDAIAQIAAGADPHHLDTVDADGRPLAVARPGSGGVEVASLEQVALLQQQVADQRVAIAELGRQLARLIDEISRNEPGWASDLLVAAHGDGDAPERRASRVRVSSSDDA